MFMWGGRRLCPEPAERQMKPAGRQLKNSLVMNFSQSAFIEKAGKSKKGKQKKRDSDRERKSGQKRRRQNAK